jgi:copper homeostasis protein
MSGRIVEISVDRIVRAEAAERGGASRIELCDSLEIGGVTPALEAMWAARYYLDGPVFAMVRPRGGDFVYTAKEFEEMRVSIDRARVAGMNGIVLGLLRGDGGVDVERTAELVREAAPLPVTFHRAFDESADLFVALEDVIATGATRLLTSGGVETAPKAVARIAELVRQARGRIVVMPGSGITAENVEEIAAGTGAVEFHAGLSSVVDQEAEPETFEAEVRRLVEAVRKSGCG